MLMFNSQNFDYPVDFLEAQEAPLLSLFPNYSSSTHHPSIAAQTSLPAFSEAYSFSDDLFVDPVLSAFPDAASQHYPAERAKLSQPSQQLPTSDNSWATLEMSDVSQEYQYNVLAIEPNTTGDNTPLRCSFLGCSEQHFFSTRAALKRHQDKHIRPFICHHVSCNRRAFGDKGGLERHKREVHGTQVYKCPVGSCKRNKKGFHRRYNLFEHQKRAHGPQPTCFLRTGSDTVDGVSESETISPKSNDEAGFEVLDGGEFQSSGTLPEVDNVSGEQDWRTKLQSLRIMRAELDEDIRSLERALSIMGGASQ